MLPISSGTLRAIASAAIACWLGLSMPASGAETPAAGQETSVTFDSTLYQQQDRAFTILYPRPVERGHFLVSIDHRTFEPLDRDTIRNFLGFDSGSLKIGLGIRYGIVEDLDAGLVRFNGATDNIDAYEFDLRYRLMSETNGIADLAVVAGLACFDGPTNADEFPFFAKAITGRTVYNRAYVSAGVACHTKSRSPAKTGSDDDFSAAAIATLEVAVFPSLSLVTEWSFPAGGYDAGVPAWSAGAKFRTFGHSFSVVISNTQNISTDGIVTGSDRWGEPIIGFTITRKF